MRPISLHIAGLQSYREKQEIDFTRLCDAGVFGIFGPTGSGKSSILDAMTLALYGKVERAAGGTQGIMNQHENTLTVAFTFELAGAGGKERYRIERQLKRGSDGAAVSTSLCRLIELNEDGEGVVLADKARDVDAKVQEILGLSMADFTRAVVLPQGKFADFLKLAGKERREMLQRLFGLEAYGSVLSSKVNARLSDTKVQLGQVLAEQQGLGDASEEALDAVKGKLREAEEEAQTARTRLLEIQKQYEEKKSIRGWQQEKESLVQKLIVVEAREEEARSAEQKLAQADQATRLKPYGERLVAARNAGVSAAAKVNSLLVSTEAARLAFNVAREASENAAAELAANEAPLAVRVNELEGALVLQQELDQLVQRAKGLKESADSNTVQLDEARAEFQKANVKREEALVLQCKLKEQLREVEVPAEQRRMLQDAFGEARTLQTAYSQFEELEREHAAAAREAADISAAEAEFAAQQLALSAQLAELAEQVLAPHAALAAAEAHAAAVQAALPQLRAQRQHRESAALAAQLAAALAPGEPCPVCGSAHHPAVAAPTAGGEAADDTGRLDRLAEDARELAFAIRQQRHRLAQLQQGLSALLPAPAPVLTEAAAAVAAELPGSDLPSLEQALELAQAQLRGVEAPLRELEAQVADGQRRHSLLDRERHAAAARKQAADSALASRADKVRAAREQLQLQRTQWLQRYAPSTLEGVEEQYKQLQAQDAEAEKIRKRIENSVPYIENTQALIDKAREMISQHEKQDAVLAAELKTSEVQRTTLTTQLQTIVGDGNAVTLLGEARTKLDTLKSADRVAKAAYQSAQTSLHEQEQALSAAKQADESAKAHLADSEQAWNEALAASTFVTYEQVLQALLNADEIRTLSEMIEQHRALDREIRIGLRNVDQLLLGRTLSEEEWAQVQLLLANCKSQDEAALQAKAKAERDRDELELKHGEWKRLEKAKAELSELSGKLGQLQSVFRGNAFVEFLAEEQLMGVSRSASERLGKLTRGRYALEVDSGGGFIIRDDANGGVRRPVSSLSGGETFLTSLALALALSAQIQLKGQYPLEFFFLDEGFGTLDGDLLETVIAALEKLHLDKLTVGVISHVPELRARLPRRLVVQPAEASGKGSRISIESL